MKVVELEPCDIFLSRGRSWFARGIRWATREKDERPTIVNHVGAIVQWGDISTVKCIEALERVKHHSFAEKYVGSGDWVAVYRPLNMSDYDKAKIIAYLHNRVGRKYGYGKIALHLLRRLTGWDGWLRYQADRWPICSYLIAKAWKHAGYDFGVHEHIATPDDIHDFVRSNKDKYRFVTTVGTFS